MLNYFDFVKGNHFAGCGHDAVNPADEGPQKDDHKESQQPTLGSAPARFTQVMQDAV